MKTIRNVLCSNFLGRAELIMNALVKKYEMSKMKICQLNINYWNLSLGISITRQKLLFVLISFTALPRSQIPGVMLKGLLPLGGIPQICPHLECFKICLNTGHDKCAQSILKSAVRPRHNAESKRTIGNGSWTMIKIHFLEKNIALASLTGTFPAL